MLVLYVSEIGMIINIRMNLANYCCKCQIMSNFLLVLYVQYAEPEPHNIHTHICCMHVHVLNHVTYIVIWNSRADTDDVFMVQTFSFDLYTRDYFYSKCCQQWQFCMKIERPPWTDDCIFCSSKMSYIRACMYTRIIYTPSS